MSTWPSPNPSRFSPTRAANLITTVRVRLTDTDYLQLNEVVVLEQGTGPTWPCQARQPIEYLQYRLPSRKSDRRTNEFGYSLFNSNYAGELGAWWEVDLGGAFDVGSIRFQLYGTQTFGLNAFRRGYRQLGPGMGWLSDPSGTVLYRLVCLPVLCQ